MLDDLASRFSVSKMTIHRDLDDLEAKGLLRKIRGGAAIETSGQFENDFRFRARVRPRRSGTSRDERLSSSCPERA